MDPMWSGLSRCTVTEQPFPHPVVLDSATSSIPVKRLGLSMASTLRRSSRIQLSKRDASDTTHKSASKTNKRRLDVDADPEYLPASKRPRPRNQSNHTSGKSRRGKLSQVLELPNEIILEVG
jgi:hypothetical protein